MTAKFPSASKILLLALGCCSAALARASTANEAVKVPFDLYHNAIIVEAKVNGKGPFSMLLDTGADPSVIDSRVAKAIGLKLASTGQQGTGGGTDSNLGYETKLPRLEIGGLAVNNLRAVALDLSKPAGALGRPIQGILGHNFLRKRVVQIDYPRHVIRFYVNSPFSKPVGQPRPSILAALSFHYRDDILVDGVSVDGKQLTANLDTGSNGTFQLTPAAVVALGLEAQVAEAPISRSTGFNGETENRMGKVKNVTIGGFSVEGPSVVFYGKDTGRDNEAWGIRIGNAFLKDFVVTLDYRRNVITLQQP